MRATCPLCGSSVSLVGGHKGIVRRHVSPSVPTTAPRAERICPASGRPLLKTPKESA